MPPPTDKRDRKPHKKVCNFCVEKVHLIDYKEVSRLSRFVSERGKILPRRVTGTCARHQRRLAVALKRARHVALLPYTADPRSPHQQRRARPLKRPRHVALLPYTADQR